MIYLIKSSGFDDNDGFFYLLKIGFTSEGSYIGRFSQYKLHNPTSIVLYTISEATEQDEKNLHRYFENLKISDYGREWFRYDKSILDYFESHKTKDSLQDLDDVTGKIISSDYYELIKSLVNRWFCIDLENTKNLI